MAERYTQPKIFLFQYSSCAYTVINISYDTNGSRRV